MALLTRSTPRWTGGFRRGAAVAIVALTLITRGAPAAPLREPEIKAAALYNIIAFTGWPDTSFASPDAPLIVGVLGQGPVTGLLGDLVTSESWHGRRVLLRNFSSAAEARSCHVLYVARSEHSRWRALSSQFARLPILTVADADNFARQGGIVQIGIERNKLRLTVNLGAARTSGVAISSKVLRLAEVIDEIRP
jgi:hypothetical protein